MTTTNLALKKELFKAMKDLYFGPREMFFVSGLPIEQQVQKMILELWAAGESPSDWPEIRKFWSNWFDQGLHLEPNTKEAALWRSA